MGVSSIYFLIREELWHSLNATCDNLYRDYQDPVFKFWQAFAYFKLGDPNEAINELLSIQHKKEIWLANIVAMMHYHNSCDNIDRDALQSLKQQREEARRLQSDKSFNILSYFYLFLKDPQRAQDMLSQCQGQSINIQLAQANIYMESPEMRQKALEIFMSHYTKGGQGNVLEVLIGLLRYGQDSRDFNLAIDKINEINVEFPDFKLGKTLKLKLCMMIGNWDELNDICTQLAYDEPENVIAAIGQALYFIGIKGDLQYGCQKLENLIMTLNFKEPKNAQLMYKVSQIFSRICGRSPAVLEHTMKIIKKARQINPLNADYAIELAFQHLILDQYDKSFSIYQEAAALDDQKVECLQGMILSKILQGHIEDAELQIEFINELQVSGGKTPETAYLEGILNSKKQFKTEAEKSQIVMKFIEEALKMHIQATKNLNPGFEFYINLNPDFLLSLSEVYLSLIGMQDMLSGSQSKNPYISRGLKVLDIILKQVPGFIVGYLMKAKGKMAMGDFAEALAATNKVIEFDKTNEDAYILNALLLSRTENYKGALNQLQQAISINFVIRENPMFMLVKGEIEYQMKDYSSALSTAESAYDLPGIKERSVLPRRMDKKTMLQFGEKDRCRIFLLLAKSFAANGRAKEAKQIMGKAISEFTGTSEEVNVLLTNSEIAIQQGDIKKAISILKGVKSDSPYFNQSRIILANVYLDHLKDRRQYAKCFYEVIENNPSFENYKMLGDAFIKIHEPEDAAQAYEKAIQLKSDDEDIVRSLGNALCKTHNYEKALNYYENALRQNRKRIDLLLDLSKLCIQIKHYSRAEELLQVELFSNDDQATSTSDVLRRNVEGFYQIARLNLKKMGQGNESENDNVRKAYRSAIALQRDVIEKVKAEGGSLDEERQYLARLNIELAQYMMKHERNFEVALKTVDEASRNVTNQEQILELKAEIYLQQGDKLQCENQCQMLLKLNPNSDFASLTLAELMLQKDENSKAIEQFKKILEDKPNNYGILAKLVDFYRRNFQLEEAKKYLEKAERKATNNNDPGLCYCRALYHRYNRSPKEALAEFNKAKKGTQYAEESLVNMIDIYLNPDQELYFQFSDEQPKQVDPENVKACESLLKELHIRGSYYRYIVMESYVLFLGNIKGGLEKGIKNLGEILKQKTEYIPAMLAMAIGKGISKKTTDAKNILKVLWKQNYTTEFGEDLERAWLLGAESFIAISKYDEAENILKKCLKFNMSCGKAEEFMGLIKEKEKSYVDAASHYEKAHILSNKKSPTIGYRLAFNYLKAKRYIDSIQICKEILTNFPNHPKIEKEVLSVARQSIR